MKKLFFIQSSKFLFAVAGIIFIFSAVFVFSIPKAHAAITSILGISSIDPIYKVLTPKDGCPKIVAAAGAVGFAGNQANAAICFSGTGQVVAAVWYDIMALVNSAVLAVLIWVAFMNILRIQMDSYAVKKILPTFIMAVILANFSFLIARMLLDIANIAISAFLTGSQNNTITGAFNNLIGEPVVGPQDAATKILGFDGNYGGYITVYILKQLALMVGAFFVAILGFVFLVRNYFLYFLVAIAPAACMALVLPITKKYFQQWFSQFLKWAFMPVISVFWLWLAGEFFKNAQLNTGWLLPLAFAGFCFYMAITTPFKVGGAAVGAWKKFGDWGRSKAQQGANYGTSRFAQMAQKKASNAKDGSITQKLWTGSSNVAAGMNPEMWRKAWKARTSTATAKRDKALLKSQIHGVVAGPEAQIAAAKQKGYDDSAYDDPTEIRGKLDKSKFADLAADPTKIKQGKLRRDYEKWIADQRRARPGVVISAQERNQKLTSMVLSKNDEELKEELLGSEGFKSAKGFETLGVLGRARQSKSRRDARDGVLSGVDAAGNPGFFPSSTTGTGPTPPPPPGGPQAVTSPELEKIDESVQAVVDAINARAENDGEEGGGFDPDQVAAAISRGGIGVGAAILPEMRARITAIDPEAAAKMLAVEKAASKLTSGQTERLQRSEAETLSSVASILKDQKNPEVVIQQAEKGEAEVGKGDFAAATETAKQLRPEAGPTLAMMSHPDKEIHE